LPRFHNDLRQNRVGASAAEISWQFELSNSIANKALKSFAFAQNPLIQNSYQGVESSCYYANAMASNFTEQLADTMKRLGLSAEQIQNAKLGPGVVGRNSKIAFSFLMVALVGVIGGSAIHSTLIIGLSVTFAFIIALAIPILNVVFGHKNPAAAILEGSQFIQYQQIMASKDHPVIIPALPVEAKPKELEKGDSDEESGEQGE
jgi:hypothetical protein